MKKLTSLLLACSLIGCIYPTAHAAPETVAKVAPKQNLDPTAIALLDKSAKAYAALNGLAMVFNAYDHSDGQDSTLSGTFAYSKSGDALLEYTKDNIKFKAATDREKLYVSPYRVSYLLDEPPLRAIASEIDASASVPFLFLLLGENPLTVDSPFFDESGIRWESATLLPDNGVKIKASFANGHAPIEFHLFFGPNDMLLRRVEAQGMENGQDALNITTISALRINPDFAPDALKFVPPAGAKEELDQLPYNPQLKVGATPLSLHGVDLNKYRGKVLLLDFRGVWSQTQLAGIANINGAYDKYHAQGLEILGIALFEDKAELQSFIKTGKVRWPQLLDTFDEEKSNTARYGLGGGPIANFFSVLIGKDGKIAAINPQGKWLGREIEKALAVKP